MVGLGSNGTPAVSSDGLSKSAVSSSVSPVPYVFNGGLRGRKSAALEKVVEWRQRRMIKNRESAARSRARKQAYTMELEAEVAKLKEENEQLQKKQAEIMEVQKNQALEMVKQQSGAKRQCLTRTQTGPW
ncbi:ABSCISIC ACID-INSENSITIVE 5-like protein 5 [Salvia hispanica]|uniref:ABSCISIC ACID-INSENSITIVE 5-like protein 5 n=1 Tax=Salvia hispanica TaxID=49212 RepID=UPI0020097CC8|nr:ABSCISIC ACID-INSENSITIVE 5-like protein 5 [Salvia hispanica]XP_047974962.1 ABSCISIC ACID-INSENSITIVE 5-like protein 5 [Salvia hispanica]